MNTKKLTVSVCLLLLTASPCVLAGDLCTNENTRTAVSTPTSDFTDNGDGTVTHTPTGLMWMRCALGQSWNGTSCSGTTSALTWANALVTTKAVNDGTSDADGDGASGFAGHTDWRVPNANELQSIAEYRCYSPSINESVFPNTSRSLHWSSTHYRNITPSSSLLVDFQTGGVTWNIETYAARIRLVRDAP